MKCGTCGYEYEGNFCPNCGSRGLEEGRSQERDQINYAPRQEKSTSSLKKMLILAAAIIGGIFIVILVIGLTVTRIESEKYINMVKTASPNDYEWISYDAAYQNFFSNPKWSYFESDGNKVVEFTGNCLYFDKDVDVCVQFLIGHDEDYVETYYLGINGLPQNYLMILTLQSAVFDNYGNYGVSGDFSPELD